MELKCSLQTYDWGRHGTESIVARLFKTANEDFVLEETKPYAELWMGTHQNGLSRLKKNDVSLKDYIAENGHVLGKGADGKVLEELPFLLKVLSVGKALSIQAHPDKKRAELLHLKQPDVYKDANHKPELAIALSPFEAFCGFRPIDEIKRYIEIIPELRTVVGENDFKNFNNNPMDDKHFLMNCFRGILVQKPETVADQLCRLIDRLSRLDETERSNLHADLLERLHADFPGDVGCFGIYLFNCVRLEVGQAIYISPNEPHAYLSGECVECMACSDNVVRAGLTPKQKDLPTLIEMLTYNCEPVSAKHFQPIRENEFTEVFRPPVADFAVAKITVNEEKSYELIPRSSASILLIVSGKVKFAGSKLHESGTALFIPAGEQIHFQIASHPVSMFQAFANVYD